MKITLFAILLMLFVCPVIGQTTYDITWQEGVNGDQASLEIEAGDTVRWIWGDGDAHNVVSVSSNSPADFGSETLSQEGYVYAYTFRKPGTVNYLCDNMPDRMYGTINVSQHKPSTTSQNLDFKIYPNPVKDHIFFENNGEFSNVEIVVFDVLGKTVIREDLTQSSIRNGVDVSNLKRGIYLVQIDNGTHSFTQKLIKN